MANEAGKVFERVKGIVGRGKGLDLGCGPFKITAEATGLDEGVYENVLQTKVLDHLNKEDPNTYDWIFSAHYLEHEKNAREVLINAERVLKPGGTLIVYLPDRRVYVDKNGNDANADHVNHWTPGEFVDTLLDNTSLILRSVERRNTTPAGHKFTGNGDTEDHRAGEWEYSFLVIATKKK